MLSTRIHLALFVLGLAAASCGAPGPLRAQTQHFITTQQWRDDLHFLANRVVAVHPDAFHHVSRRDFDLAVAKLDAAIPALSDHQIEVEFIRLVAMLGEGHSRVSLPDLPDPMSDVSDVTPVKDASLAFHRLPIELHAFSDGLFVVATTPEFQRYLGAKVLSIGDHSAADALAAVEPLVNRDNEIGVRLVAPVLVTIPEVLKALDVVPDENGATIVLLNAKGEKEKASFSPLAAGVQPQWQAVPHYVRHDGQNFWLEYPADGTLFVKINVLEDATSETVTGFAARIGALAKGREPTKVIMDFRGCHGGDNQKFRALLLAFVRDPRIDRLGKFFVVMDRETFSAAVNALSDLEHVTNAIFVGEPAAGSPNSWGDPKKIVLPNSGLIARISTLYWRDWTTDPTRSWIAPDIATPVSSRDFFNGRDPDIEAISRFPVGADFGNTLEYLLHAGAGIGTILRLYYQHRTDPLMADASTESAMQRVGTDLLRMHSYKEALLVFQINFGDYPESLPDALQAVREAQIQEPKNAELANLAATLSRLQPPKQPSAK